MTDLEKAKQFFVAELRREPAGPMDECHIRFAAKYASHSNAELLERVQKLEQALASDIRAVGWDVAVHNDYRINGRAHTFWLFTKGDRCVKGEGATDAFALNQVRTVLAADSTAERKV